LPPRALQGRASATQAATCHLTQYRQALTGSRPVTEGARRRTRAAHRRKHLARRAPVVEQVGQEVGAHVAQARHRQRRKREAAHARSGLRRAQAQPVGRPRQPVAHLLRAGLRIDCAHARLSGVRVRV